MKRGRGLLLGTSLVALTGLVALARDEGPERASAHGRVVARALHETIPVRVSAETPPPEAPPSEGRAPETLLPEWARTLPPGGPVTLPEPEPAPASFEALLENPDGVAALVLANPSGLEDRARAATTSPRLDERRLGLEVLAALASRHAAPAALAWLEEGLDPLPALDALSVPSAELAERVRPLLADIARNGQDPEARRLAVQRLAAWGGELSPWLASPHVEVRVAAALALAEGSPDRASRAELARLAFSDPAPEARDAAARALATLSDLTTDERSAIETVEREQGLER